MCCAGTNACYVEQTRNISKWKPKYLPRTPEMVVNIEWPGFHSEVLPQLEEDIELDRESSHPGDQGFEKLTAGLYLGDTARRIIHRSPAFLVMSQHSLWVVCVLI